MVCEEKSQQQTDLEDYIAKWKAMPYVTDGQLSLEKVRQAIEKMDSHEIREDLLAQFTFLQQECLRLHAEIERLNALSVSALIAHGVNPK